MKKILTGFILGLMATAVMAVPAKKVVRTVAQSDGSKIEICLTGDESFHYYATTDGQPLVETSSGYVYAKVEGKRLVSTEVLAHNQMERGVGEHSFLRFSSNLNRQSVSALWRERMAERNAHRLTRAMKTREANRQSWRKAPSAGATANKRGLVILVNFSDSNMVFSQSMFNDQFNKEGYNKNRHIGSVRDYFHSQSYGQLTIDFDVVGPYKLSKGISYYGENDSHRNDKHAGQMVAEACGMANADVNFQNYDWDNDGEVDQVYVIYAGYGEASGADPNTVWPHEWDLISSDYGNSLLLDGVKINTYACSNELANISGQVMEGIGTACHEFSHCLGLPDFYDTTTDGCNFGMATWSLMDYGCYNGPFGFEGNVPCAYTAYERYYTGWIEPTELVKGCEINDMADITEKPESYIIRNDNHEDEFYILTNIQKTSWNRYAYGHGLLVVHVDYNEEVWYNNEVNNDSIRQRCTIIPADNDTPVDTVGVLIWKNSLEGDPFPGTSNTTALTDDGKPSAILYYSNKAGKKLMGKPLTDITETDGKISFVFNGGTPLDSPIATEASDLTDSSFTANWEKVEAATMYTLQLQRQEESDVEIIMMEDFSRLKNSDVPPSLEISGSINDYTGINGWNGSKLSPAKAHSVKLGSSIAVGSITTPTFNAPSTENITVFVVGAPYGSNNEATFNVIVDGKSFQISLNDADAVSFSGVNKSFNATIETTADNKRGYIDEIRIYDGIINADQIASAGNSGKSLYWKTVQTIDSLSEGEYMFKGLEVGLYRYHVAATDGTRVSEWSNEIEVQLGAKRGDVNEDGKVDINDVVAIINQMAGTASWRYADVNGDITVDINDVVAVINEMATTSSSPIRRE